MATDPNWKPDPAKVAAVIADARAEVAAQTLLVDKLDELLDDERRELDRRQRMLDDRIAAWRAHGIEVPE